MFPNTPRLHCLGLLAGLIALAGCSSNTVLVKDITADKNGYLTKQFTAQSLTEKIAKKVPSDSPSVANFRELRISGQADSESADGKKESAKSSITFVNAGNGLVQRLEEMSSNDIPYALFYALTYKGLVDLRWQNVPLRNQVGNRFFELKDATRFDSFPSPNNGDFVVDYTTGTEGQVANFGSYQKACKIIGTRAAKEVHAKLTGQALDIECEGRNDNILTGRTRFVFLKHYEVAIGTGGTSSARKSKYTITDVSIVN